VRQIEGGFPKYWHSAREAQDDDEKADDGLSFHAFELRIAANIQSEMNQIRDGGIRQYPSSVLSEESKGEKSIVSGSELVLDG
jgi:hypothetical protein